MDPKKYARFTLEDYLCDDDFLRYIQSPTADDEAFWREYLVNYPLQKKRIEQARSIVGVYQHQETFYNENAQAKVFSSISATIKNNTSNPRRLRFFNTYYRIAACLFLAVLSIFLYRLFHPTIKETTHYAEVKRFILPDGSAVTLNGNSTMRYARNFKDGKREVWINGEGLFEVRHLNTNPKQIQPGEKFTVHCNDLDITVLGTTFNVKNRREKTNVGLLSGKILVSYTDVPGSKAEKVILAPGDYLRRSHSAKPKLEKLADVEKLTVWVNHQLSFQDATVEDMLQVLEDDLGYHIDLEADFIKTNKIEGDIKVNNVKDLLRIISNTQHVTIQLNNKNITIKP